MQSINSRDKLKSAVIVLGAVEGTDKVLLVAGVTQDQTAKIKAGELDRQRRAAGRRPRRRAARHGAGRRHESGRARRGARKRRAVGTRAAGRVAGSARFGHAELLSLIVQKYGGTSVGSLDLIRRVADKISAARRDGTNVVVVVSAMGDSTDRLVDLARGLCQEPDAREMDVLLATGEQVSVALLCMALRNQGCAARSYTGAQVRVLTSNVHTPCAHHRTGRDRTAACGYRRGRGPRRRRIPGRGRRRRHHDHRPRRLGHHRGGARGRACRPTNARSSPTSTGSTPPTRAWCPTARRLDRVTFEEMLELAGQGSRVLHLRSVEFASKYNVPLRVHRASAPAPARSICREEPRVEAPVVSGIAFNRDEAEITVAGVPDVPGTAFRAAQAGLGCQHRSRHDRAQRAARRARWT